MAYRRPSDLRWEYRSPLQTLLVVRAGNVQRLIRHGGVWVADASAKLEAMKIVLGEINLWLDGNFASSRTFRPELRPAQPGQPARVELYPVDPSLGKIISRITITFAERPGTVNAIDIIEEGEGVTHITFEDATTTEPSPTNSSNRHTSHARVACLIASGFGLCPSAAAFAASRRRRA